jgi:hypothetical protein
MACLLCLLMAVNRNVTCEKKPRQDNRTEGITRAELPVCCAGQGSRSKARYAIAVIGPTIAHQRMKKQCLCHVSSQQ